MKNIGRRLFLISFIFAILTAASIYMYLSSLDQSDDSEEVEMMTILVAAVDIEPRTIIEEEMIKEIEVVAGNEYGNFINDIEEIVGLYSKEKIYTNERFHSRVLIEDTNNELSLKIKGDRRAISINAALDVGVANLLKSGDFIDVFVSLPELKVGGDVVRPDVSKLILQNIEVLAVDQNLDREPEVLEEVKTNIVLTLAVPIMDIEGLMLAESIGTLKLALRPVGKDYIYQTDGAIWEDLFLDDYGHLKDLFPNYEVESEGKIVVEDKEYVYDKYYYYTIKRGDTLRKISKEFYDDEEMYILLKQVNRIEDEDTILEGSNINIPIIEDMTKEGEGNE